mgnify:CR=1 FL=1
MANSNVLTYPRGAIALGNGDLADVTNVKVSHKNSGKLIHTLHRTPSGVYRGSDEGELSFDAVCSENGPERDYFKLVRSGTVKQFRIKIPGETISVQGIVTARELDLPLDDAIKYSITVVGAIDIS